MKTLIAFKPSSEDTCRGCLMASYSEDFAMYRLNDEDLVKKLSEYFEKNANGLGLHETGYDFAVLEGDKKLWGELYFESGYEEGDEETQEVINLINQAKDKIESVKRQKDEEKKRQRLEEQERNKKYQEAEKLRTYERLKAEFESK